MRALRSRKKFFHTLDIAILAAAPLFAAVISIATESNFLVSTLLFFGVPAAWLSLRVSRKKLLKSIIFSLSTMIPLVLVFDHLAVIDQSWYVPFSAFPFRILGTIPVEDAIWGLLLGFFIILFYEHFLDRGSDVVLHPHMRFVFAFFSVLLIVFFLVLAIRPDFHIPYLYFLGGIFLILLPTVAMLAMHPELIKKVAITSAYFFPLGLLVELVGLRLNQWSFPGTNFIGYVELLGYRFPFEEFFFYFVLFAACVLAFYEFFDDDNR